MNELTNILDKPLFFTEVEQFKSISSGRQKEYFTVLSKIIKEIKVSRLSSIFTKEQIEEIRRLVNPKQKQCYKNAQTFALLFKQVHYSECRLDIEQVMSIDHAINKIGDKYVDITLELCLGDNPENRRYTLIKDFTDKDVSKVQEETRSYANVYETLYRLNH